MSYVWKRSKRINNPKHSKTLHLLYISACCVRREMPEIVCVIWLRCFDMFSYKQVYKRATNVHFICLIGDIFVSIGYDERLFSRKTSNSRIRVKWNHLIYMRNLRKMLALYIQRDSWWFANLIARLLRSNKTKCWSFEEFDWHALHWKYLLIAFLAWTFRRVLRSE